MVDKFDPVRLDEKSTTSAVMATIDIHEYAGKVNWPYCSK